MAQAKRIKPKPKRKPKKARVSRALPWGLMSVILVSGVVLGVLLNGAYNGDGSFGAGLKTILDKSQSTTESDANIAELIQEKSSKTDLDFYKLLPDIEKVMPEDLFASGLF